MEDKLNKLIFLTEEGNNLKKEIIKLLSKDTKTFKSKYPANTPTEKYSLEQLENVVSKLRQSDLTEANVSFIRNIVDYGKQKGFVTAKQFMSISNMQQDQFHYMKKTDKSYE